MIYIKKPGYVLTLLLGSLPVMMFFQNCGQAGGLSLMNSKALSNGSSEVAGNPITSSVPPGSMIIDPGPLASGSPNPSPSPSSNPSESSGSLPGAIGSAGGSVAAGSPAVGSPGDGPVSGGSHSGHHSCVKNSDDDNDHDENHNHNHNYQGENDTDKDKDDIKGSKISDRDHHEDCDDNDNDNNNDNNNKNDKDQDHDDSRCRGISIADILLSVDSVAVGSSGEDSKNSSFEIVDVDKTISLNKLNLKVKALKSAEIKEIFMVLNAQGNKILDASGKAMNLKTPSGQTSGIKVQLGKEVSVEANRTYTLQLEISSEDQIVANPNKCIFKPVIKNASLTLAQ